MTDLPENVLEMVNQQVMGYDAAMGLRFISIGKDELRAEVEVGDQHRQPYGLVHGGVYAGIVESLCSVGAAVNVFAEGKNAVGLENSTSFLRAVRAGKLHCTARPEHRGARSQVWITEIRDDEGRLAATGRVRMMVLEPGAQAGGATVELPTD
jgi:1,4-dihydroxy-2-naphthoyl-CoA hydrolase